MRRNLLTLGQAASVKSSRMATTALVLDAARHVFPYLSDGILAELRQRLRPNSTHEVADRAITSGGHLIYFLAALCGMHAEMSIIVASWPDDLYGRQQSNNHYHMPQQMVFGLGDPHLVDHDMRRLKLACAKPTSAHWLAHSGLNGLDYVYESIQAETNKNEAASLFKDFALVKAPEAAPYMLELKLNSKIPMLARQWLDENPRQRHRGADPHGRRTRQKGRRQALDFLRETRRQGHAVFIEEHLKSVPVPRGCGQSPVRRAGAHRGRL